jgi:putative hydrolase
MSMGTNGDAGESKGSRPAAWTIDWRTAQRVGELVAGSTPRGGPTPRSGPLTRPASPATPSGGDVQELAHDFARRVSDYTGLALPAELPPLELVDRPAWIAANLRTMRPLLDPLGERLSGAGDDAGDTSGVDTDGAPAGEDGGKRPEDDRAEGGAHDGRADWRGPAAGPLRAASGYLRAASGTASGYLRAASDAASGPLGVASGHLFGAQLGAVTGVLSQRVLGQYDVALVGPAAPPRLLLLEPNLATATRNLSVDRDELTAWVAIHEITHAVQFAGAPWLRGHLGGMLEELLAGLVDELRSSDGGGELDALLARARNGDLRRLVERARRGELLRVGLGEQRWALVERMQATMSLIEGHAEHTMDAVGDEVLPSLGRLRAAMTRRRTSRGLPWRVLERLLGLELKMRQYEVGRRFCDAVVREGGPRALALAWRSPAELPSAAELEDPRRWLERVYATA